MRIFLILSLGVIFTACGPDTETENGLTKRDIEKHQAEKAAPTQKSWLAAERSTQKKTVEISKDARPLVIAARNRLKSIIVYDGRYIGIDYPGGDVSPTIGVCTDVVIRSLRKAYNFDLQVAVHEDMKAHFDLYPKTWGHTRTDTNIDHRRVPNLEVWFTRARHSVSITQTPEDYRPGDIVSWRLDSLTGGDGLPHIGIVSHRLSQYGTPLIIHNIGRGPEESDILFDHTITGHYRLKGEKFRP